MEIRFEKYHGAGNDFIILDNRRADISLTSEQIKFLCDRRFGIGADGLMLLENEDEFDYRMVYFNADGNESSMCGNGGRCISLYANKIGVASDMQQFIAIDGAHQSKILSNKTVSLQMKDISEINFESDCTILDTGSPHYVKFVKATQDIDVFTEGRNIRNQQQFQPKGINVNFVENTESGLKIRTYERGVEDETLACGTGVTAAAIASVCTQTGSFTIDVQTLGGNLQVSFNKTGKQSVEDVWLTGPAVFVFQGIINI